MDGGCVLPAAVGCGDGARRRGGRGRGGEAVGVVEATTCGGASNLKTPGPTTGEFYS